MNGISRHAVCLVSVLYCARLAVWSAETTSADESVALFTGAMAEFRVILTPDASLALGRVQGMNDPHHDATATVVVGTQTYTNVEIHLKGSGSFRPLKYRPSFTLKFRKSQPCLGLTKLHLNNSVHDPARLNEALASELHLQAGIPTPRATPVRVHLNDRDLGLYVLKEGFDERFLKRHFPDATGNLYDPSWAQDIDSPLECDSGPGKTSREMEASRRFPRQPERERLVNALDAPVSTRLSAATQMLDVGLFFDAVGLQILLDDWDGYARHHNNFRLYWDPSQERFVFLPHGMDLLLGTPQSPIYWPEFTGLVARHLFETPGVPQRIKARIESLQQTVFTETNLLAIVDRTSQRIQSALVNEPERVRRFYDERANSLRQRVRRRLAVLHDGPPAPVVLLTGQSVVLSGWEPWAEIPQTDLIRATNAAGKPVLSIQANTPATYGSWRTRLVLPAGDYRFEGKAQLYQVRSWENARDPGVGLRIVPGRRGPGASGSTAAQPLQHGFRLKQSAEVFFVAELSAHSGKVEFLEESLQVTRTGIGAPDP